MAPDPLLAALAAIGAHVPDLVVTLVGSAVGVSLAFAADRWWERRQAKQLCATALHACRPRRHRLMSPAAIVPDDVPKEWQAWRTWLNERYLT